MKIPILLMPIVLLYPVPGAVAQEEKTKEERSDELVNELKDMRREYKSLLAECSGGAPMIIVDGQVVGGYSAPDQDACDEAEELKEDYSRKYKDLLKLDRRRVLFDNIPKKIDAS